MGDSTISGLAVGNPAQLGDLAPVARGGLNKKLTVQQLLDAAGLAAAGGSAVTTDLLLSNRAGVAQSLTVDNILSLAPKQNWLDNTGFELNQRRSAGNGLTTAYAYGPVDRWAFKMATAAAGLAVQQANGATGEPYRVRLNRTAGSALVNPLSMVQILETVDVTKLQGKTMCLVWKAQASANYSPAGSLMGIRVDWGTGTDQGLASYDAGTWTGQANLLNVTQAITAGPVFYYRQITIPATATELAVQFNFTPTGVAGADDSLYMYHVGLFEGTNPPNNFAADPYPIQQFRCQRHLAVWSAAKGTGARLQAFASNNTTFNPIVNFKVPLRAAPTNISVSSPADFLIYNYKTGGAAFAPTGIVFNAAGENDSLLAVSITAGSPVTAIGDGGILFPANTNATIIWTGSEL